MKNARLVIAVFATLAILGVMLPVIPVKAVMQVPSLQYPHIQDAVDAYHPINNPQSILVSAGIYQEHVCINRSKTNLVIEAQPGATLDGMSCTLPYGFEIDGTANVIIRGFTIRNYREAGIYIHRDNSVMLRGFGNKIERNTIENCVAGIVIGASDFNMLLRNTVQSNGKIGIFIDDGVYNRIRWNNVHHNAHTGIEVHIAPYTDVRDNTVWSNNGYGFNADGYSWRLKIMRNNITLNVLGGIYVISGANQITKNDVISNGGHGIIIKQADYNNITANKVESNVGDGILVSVFPETMDPSDHNIIEGNKARWNVGNGISVVGADWNKVWNNTARWNGQCGIKVTSDPIYSTYTPDHDTIYSNKAQGNTSYDLYWDETGSGNHWGTGDPSNQNTLPYTWYTPSNSPLPM